MGQLLGLTSEDEDGPCYRIVYRDTRLNRDVASHFTYPWPAALEMVRRSLEDTSRLRARRVERA